MFEKEAYVFHESGGVCRIDDIQTAPLDNMPADRQYYVMKPVHDPNSVIYIPVDSDCIYLRPLMDRAQAEALIDRIPEVDTIDEPNAKLLRTKYIEAMRTHDPVEWVRVIKTVHLRTDRQSPRAGRISETERSFAENAKRNLHTELALALGLHETDMESYIAEHIPKMA